MSARASRRAVLSTASLAAVAALAGPGAQDAAHLQVSLELPNVGRPASLLGDLTANCALFYAGSSLAEGPGRLVRTTVGGPASGTLDPAARSGSASAPGAQWLATTDDLGRGRVRFADLGVAFAGSRLYVTGRRSGRRTGPASGPRRRLGVVRGARFEGGPLVDRAGRPVPNTFGLAVRGRLVLLAAMSGPLGRLRCRRPLPRPPRIRAGTSAGRVLVQLRPAQASGLAGDAQVRLRGPEGIAVEPTGGATAGGEPGDVTTPITSGLPVPLACAVGEACLPRGGAYGLGGGFDLVAGGARASVTALTVRVSGAAHTVTGMLNGVPVELSSGPVDRNGPWTTDFRARAGAALGTGPLDSGFLGVDPRFTRTGP